MSDETQDPNRGRDTAVTLKVAVGEPIIRDGVHVFNYPFSPVHEERMKALADYVEAMDPALFTMAQYRREGDESFAHCGTLGCILGHAPRLLTHKFRVSKRSLLDMKSVPSEYKHPTTGKPEIPRKALDFIPIDFGKVFTAVTGYTQERNSGLWEYLFSGVWAHRDNTPTGAAKRIRWVLTHHGIPQTYPSQVHGSRPLNYEARNDEENRKRSTYDAK